MLDIGTGANVIYPLIGNSAYGWQLLGPILMPMLSIRHETISA
jgi:23S rRNA A1618 N6-methylase RlmF